MGLPPQAVAGFINAEATKVNGVWKADSYNSKSGAMGLTQFLASTWKSEACKPGTNLHDYAVKNGLVVKESEKSKTWKIVDEKKDELLELRKDPNLNILASADYAAANMANLRDSYPDVSLSQCEAAKVAYLLHHEGAGGARVLLKGSGKLYKYDRNRFLTQIGAGRELKTVKKLFPEAISVQPVTVYDKNSKTQLPVMTYDTKTKTKIQKTKEVIDQAKVNYTELYVQGLSDYIDDRVNLKRFMCKPSSDTCASTVEIVSRYRDAVKKPL